jgi:hypothetical protein
VVVILFALALVASAPGVPNGVDACTAKSLRATAALQGASGSMAGGIRVRNRGGRACRLGGRPRAALRTRRGRVLVARHQAAAVFTPFKAVDVLAPGRSAFAFVQWSNWCGHRPASGPARYVRRLVLDIALGSGARLRVPLRTGQPRCDSPGAPSVLAVSPFAREDA